MQKLGAQQDKGPKEAVQRCPDCGGLNPSAAEWCGQCLRSFASPQSVPPPPVPPPPGAESAPPLTTQADPLFAPTPRPETAAQQDAPNDVFDPLLDPLGIGFGSPEPPSEGVDDAAETPGNDVAAPVAERHGAFAVAGGEISWTCDRCETDNELSARVCKVCGTRFADTVVPRPERVRREPNTVALISLFFPGAGHAYLGMWGQAIARGALSIWVLAVILVAGIQNGVPGSSAILAVFGVTAFALWGLAAHDAYREACDDPRSVILKPRMFLYVTVGLLFVLFVSLMVAGVSANR